jgi:hypothetical protein
MASRINHQGSEAEEAVLDILLSCAMNERTSHLFYNLMPCFFSIQGALNCSHRLQPADVSGVSLAADLHTSLYISAQSVLVCELGRVFIEHKCVPGDHQKFGAVALGYFDLQIHDLAI